MWCCVFYPRHVIEDIRFFVPPPVLPVIDEDAPLGSDAQHDEDVPHDEVPEVDEVPNLEEGNV